MKKVLALSLFVTSVLASVTAHADVTKQDGLLRMTKASYEAGKIVPGKAIIIKEGREMIECLIKSSDPSATAAAITGVGGEVRAVIGRIMTAQVPLDAIDAISDREDVIYIEAARPMTSKMNEARSITNVASVQEGTGLDKAYNGNGVLVGVVDTDLDWQHDDFMGSDDKTRICYVMQKTQTGGTRECTKSDIDGGSCSVTPGGADLHGTHVTGIAAGSNSTYRGVAPESNIAFVFNNATDPDTSGTGSTSFSTTVLEGVATIFAKADDYDMPAVINLSLGTSIGAHDDTSLLEQGLAEALLDDNGNPKGGRAIVNASGNENMNINDVDASIYGGIHAPINISPLTRAGYGVAIRSEQISGWAWNDAALVDVWLADSADCRNVKIEVKAYRRNVYSSYNTANQTFGTDPIDFNADRSSTKKTTDDKVTVSVNTYTTNAQNSRPEAVIFIGPNTGTGTWTDIVKESDDTVGYFFDVIIEGVSGSCTGDMWLYPDQTGLIDFWILSPTVVSGTGGYQYIDGDSNKTMTVPGTASAVITVGSFMDHTDGKWTDIDGNVHDQTDYAVSGTGGTVGSISLFSSLGPTGETTAFRTKPDLVAPGEPIISTLGSAVFPSPARMDLGDTTHFKLEGSSMSSPHVAGIVALLFEKNNCLTATEVKNALTSTASQAGAPDDTYGYGKVNALAAMVGITANSSCYSGTACGGGGDGGGGGCGGMVVPVSAATGIVSIFAIIVPLGILVTKRRRKYH